MKGRQVQLKPRIKQDIEENVERILEELGHPEPPLRLEVVRELLRLDRSYFSGEANGLMAKTFSRLSRAGQQLLKRPSLLADAVREFNIRALYLPDQKRILIDDKVPTLKRRWLEAHEVGHDLLPWHQEVMWGDDDITPMPSVHSKIEAEANYAAGVLLFLNKSFQTECLDLPPTIASAKILNKRYGNTLTTTVWRMIEHADRNTPLLGLIGIHPDGYRHDGANFEYIVPSQGFHENFTPPDLNGLCETIWSYCERKKGHLGQGTVEVRSREGGRHEFIFETFFNGYQALTLGRHSKKMGVLL